MWVRATLEATSPSSRRAWIEINEALGKKPPGKVALLAEGVDRNILLSVGVRKERAVALLAEGVDRNVKGQNRSFKPGKSPSSRRAWIEILCLPAEAPQRTIMSPSSRRAWIEISLTLWTRTAWNSRPPRGGRG